MELCGLDVLEHDLFTVPEAPIADEPVAKIARRVVGKQSMEDVRDVEVPPDDIGALVAEIEGGDARPPLPAELNKKFKGVKAMKAMKAMKAKKEKAKKAPEAPADAVALAPAAPDVLEAGALAPAAPDVPEALDDEGVSWRDGTRKIDLFEDREF